MQNGRVSWHVEDMATVVADLAKAAGNALDPSSILSRTMAVLEPVVHLGSASLWGPGPRSDELVAAHPRPGDADALGPDLERVAAGALTLPLTNRDHSLGTLVVRPAAGTTFSSADEALLAIAASQIAGALERSQLYAEIMELERLKSDFIARVSHELRTPITIISGFLETLIAHDRDLETDQRVHMLERSRTASARLGDLIEELLILSRIEGGVLTPQPEELQGNTVLEGARLAASEPDQVIVASSEDHRIIADRALLTRALGLVIDNAVKYGGVAELSARTEGARWIVEVRDRGPGFPDDVRDTAFEMFTRSQSNASVPGLGVGLAIARTLVEILDGTIEIDLHHAGPGALVRISIPA